MRNLWYLNIVFGLGLVFAIVQCGNVQGPQGPAGPSGPQGPVATPEPLTLVQQLVASQNDLRASQGNGPLVEGLQCALYTVPNTTTSIATAVLTGVGTYGYTGVFNQPNSNVSDGLNILPLPFRTVYQTWFMVRCYGNLVIADNNWHSFALSSDDGAVLYIDGLLIDNDGMHGVQTKQGVRFLQWGFHSFQLDFLQGAGSQALILYQDGDIMQSTGFYH